MLKRIAVACFLLTVTYSTSYATVIGSRPSGCPHRYCGCALSIKLFGKIVKDLNLAINWAIKFPRTNARVGAVAARRGHVLQIVGPERRKGEWLVWDANSGGGKIRLHYRKLAGYVFVDPTRGRASNDNLVVAEDHNYLQDRYATVN